MDETTPTPAPDPAPGSGPSAGDEPPITSSPAGSPAGSQAGSPADPAGPAPQDDVPPPADPPLGDQPGPGDQTDQNSQSNQTGQGGRKAQSEVDAFFDRIRSFGTLRPESGRWFAGVAGGLARRFDLDPLLVRGGFFVLAVISGGLALVLYGLGWLLLPQEDGRIHAQELLRGRFSAGFVGGAVVFLLGVTSTDGPGFGGGFVGGGWFWPFPGMLLFIPAVVFLAWWFGSGKHRPEGQWPPAGGGPGYPGPGYGGPGHGGPGHGGPGHGGPGHGGPGTPGHGGEFSGTPADATPSYGPPPLHPEGSWQPAGAWNSGTPGHGGTAVMTAVPPAPPRPPDHERPLHALTLGTVGLALIAAACIGLWDRFVDDLPGSAPVIAGAVALAVVALGVIAAGLLGRRCGGLAPIGVLLAVGVLVSGSVARVDDHLDRTTTWPPTTRSAAAAGYKLDVGRLIVDLTSPALLAQDATTPAEVKAEVGVGEIKIMLPDGVSAEVHSRVGLGSGPRHGDLVSGKGARSGAGVDAVFQVGDGPTRFVVDARVGLGAVSVVDETGREIR